MKQLIPSAPLAVIDVEASALSAQGFPIEVGIAIWRGADQPMLTWSSLIKPIDTWLEDRIWSNASEKVHGIALSDLETAPPVHRVATALNNILGPIGTAHCDGLPFDAEWLSELFRVAEIKPAFLLESVAYLRPFGGPRMHKWLSSNPAPHRAGGDAVRLLRAYLYGLKIRTGPPVMINPQEP